MTAYSSAIATWSTSTLSPNSITLNGTAVDNMNAAAAKYLTIGLINNEHDYSNVTATAVYSKFNGVRFDPTGVYRAYLSVTHAASGFSLDVNGVLGTNIGDINKVDQASIAGLNGVSA